MFKIPKIEKSEFYIKQSIKSMQDFALKEKDAIHERFKKNVSSQRKTKEEINLNKRKDLELQKIRHLNFKINGYMRKIKSRFPRFDKIEDIYVKLIDASEVSSGKIKKESNELLWIAQSIDELTKNSEYKLKKAKSEETVGYIMKKHLGKVSSYFKKTQNSFENLEKASKYLNSLPRFQDLFTVSIGGFPNVGKSTLLNKITGSKVEIQNYPFTTKSLMFGYLENNGKNIVQLIDTPGLLNRDKNNNIEQRALIVIREYCDKIVFVLDITESCGFDIKSQLKLLKNTQESRKDIIIYLSKTDIYDEEDDEKLEEIDKTLKKFKVFKEVKELKKEIIEMSKKDKKAFNPKNIKLIK